MVGVGSYHDGWASGGREGDWFGFRPGTTVLALSARQTAYRPDWAA